MGVETADSPQPFADLSQVPVASTSASSAKRWSGPLAGLLDRFEAWRDELALPNPGTSENLTREIKATHLSNYFFDGARADLTKGLAINPAFQITHSFTLGGMSAGPMGPTQNPGNYSFGALYASDRLFSQGTLDQDGSLMGRLNYGWTKSDTTKVQAQLAPSPSAPSMIQIEHDHHGRDYSANFKALNPSLADATGVYVGSYLQSITRRLALGIEAVYQRPDPVTEDAALAYLVKYTGGPGKGKIGEWIATTQLQTGQGVVQSTYWQRLGERVEAGAELMLALGNRKGQATVGAKYDFRTATFRAQVDSQGKIGALLEQRFTPAFAFLVGGEIDQWKNTSRFGLGIMLESSSPEIEAAAQAGATPVAPPM